MTAVATQTQANAVVALRKEVRAEATKSVLRAVGRSLLTFLLTILAVLVLWVGVLWVTGVSPFVAKGPIDVWNYLFVEPEAADHRAELGANLVVTLSNAFVGFAAGLVAALLVAIVFQLSRGVEHALMPVAMLLRSVPLVALAPVIILIFGRDVWTVAIMGGIVVLFPALVNIAFGLKDSSPQMNDVVHVYGGGAWAALRKVALPASLPSLFAAVRISVPGAITGALLAEWLATGTGIGGVVGTYKAQAQFTALWTSVVVITIVALVLYNLVQLVENVVLARMGMHPDRQR